MVAAMLGLCKFTTSGFTPFLTAVEAATIHSAPDGSSKERGAIESV